VRTVCALGAVEAICLQSASAFGAVPRMLAAVGPSDSISLTLRSERVLTADNREVFALLESGEWP
jgi:hypothetical protein